MRGMAEAPLYVSVAAAARALGVATGTLRRWLHAGLLSGVRPGTMRSYGSSPHRGGLPHYRVCVASIEALLASAAAGGPAPASVRRRLRAAGKPLPRLRPRE